MASAWLLVAGLTCIVLADHVTHLSGPSVLWNVAGDGPFADRWTNISVASVSQTISLPLRVPGSLLDALQQAGFVHDPLTGLNEQAVVWALNKTYEFSTNFTLPAHAVQQQDVQLVLLGVDTVADVLVNGRLVAQVANYYRHYRVAIKGVVKPGHNELCIRVLPAVRIASERQERYHIPLPSLTHVGGYRSFPGIRKPAAHFGWDWGPALPLPGIHGHVHIHAFSLSRLTGVLVRQQHHPDKVTLSLECELLSPQGLSAVAGTLHAVIPGLSVRAQLPVRLTDVARSSNARHKAGGAVAGGETILLYVSMEVYVGREGMQLWWPHGYGLQHLYDLHITFQPQGVDGCGAGAQQQETGSSKGDGGCSHVHRRVGFRMLELVQDPMPKAAMQLIGRQGIRDARAADNRVAGLLEPDRAPPAPPTLDPAKFAASLKGSSFYLRVNGVPIFAKGTNMVMPEIIPSRVLPGSARRLMEACVRANMNTVRIWGGGEFGSEELYQAADELGLMVLQDFMFACAPYPAADEQFQAEVDAEVRQVVRRLGSYTSLAVWVGGNEVESSFRWYNLTRVNPQPYLRDFAALFMQQIPAILNELDPGRPYLDNSPASQHATASPATDVNATAAARMPEAGVRGKRRPAAPGPTPAPMSGDIHYYNFIDDCMDTNTLPTPRFVSEFGWQSLASFEVLRRVTAPGDWRPFQDVTPTMALRQRRRRGEREVMNQVRRNMHLPRLTGADAAEFARTRINTGDQNMALFKRWLFVTQLSQALCDSGAIRHWRAHRGEPAALTMGSLYWQLNDVWPAYSWASLDHGARRWKVAHYAIRTAFAPVVISHRLTRQGGKLLVFATSDLPAAVTLQLSVHVVRVDLPAPTTSLCGQLGSVAAKRAAYLWSKGTSQAGKNTGEDRADTSSADADGTSEEQFFDDGLMPSLEVKRQWFELQPLSSAMVWAFNAKELLAARSGCGARQCFLVVRAAYADACKSTRHAGVESPGGGSSSDCGGPERMSAEEQLAGTGEATHVAGDGVPPSTLAAARCAHCAALREQAAREATWAAALHVHATAHGTQPPQAVQAEEGRVSNQSAAALLGPGPSLLTPHAQPQPRPVSEVELWASGGVGWSEVVVTLGKMKHMYLGPPNITITDLEEMRLDAAALAGGLAGAQPPTAGGHRAGAARSAAQHGHGQLALPAWGVCFTAHAQAAALHLVFISQLDGVFSDNAFVLLPCAPRRLCFWLWERPPGLTAAAATGADPITRHSSTSGLGLAGAQQGGDGTQLTAGPPAQSVSNVCGWESAHGERDNVHTSGGGTTAAGDLLSCFQRTLSWESAFN